MTTLDEKASELVGIFQCGCGAEMKLSAIERRSPHVELQIFSCSRCLRELRVHVSDVAGPEVHSRATGL